MINRCIRINRDSNEKIKSAELSDYYNKIFEGYNREITTLWQRSIFLGSFLLGSYTAYGMLLGKAIEYEKMTCNAFFLFNAILSVVALICVLMSILWIIMTKGSKAHQEAYERTLRSIEKIHSPYEHIKGSATQYDDCMKDLMPSSVTLISYEYCHNLSKKYGPDGYDHFLKPTDVKLFSPNGGKFSPSKVNIVLGIISYCFSLLLVGIHVLFPIFLQCCRLKESAFLCSRFLDYFACIFDMRLFYTIFSFAIVTTLISSFFILKEKTKSNWL